MNIGRFLKTLIFATFCATGLIEACERAEEKHWAIPITFDYKFACQAFNACGMKTSVVSAMVGDELSFNDLSLFVKLCNDNKVRIDNVDARAPERGGALIGPNAPFGGYRDDLYPTLLAPTKVSFTSANEHESSTNVSVIYRQEYPGFLDCDDTIAISGGITLPFKYLIHTLEFQLYDGSLFRQIFSPTNTVRENVLYQFFDDYSSVDDFFIRGILGDNGIMFASEQQKCGIGDLALFGSFEWINPYKYIDDWQSGITIIFPTGGKYDGIMLWETALGNGGAYQVDLFTHLMFKTDFLNTSCASLLNPWFRLAFEFSSSFCTKSRIPQQVSNSERAMVEDIAGLKYFPDFELFWVDPFIADTTTVPLFGNLVNACVKHGWQAFVGIGDYIYNPFYDNFRLGLFYDFTYKAKDCIQVAGKSKAEVQTYQTGEVENLTLRKMHRIGWNLTYKAKNYMELTIGSYHVVAGKNTPQTHDLFVSFALVF